ncbi:hypothetical protein Asp14428_21740 [Actinoplanes sp. NBRC 14428]|uniref:Uncharacterized protein n=1 Tax=Pseudosporangium ferrugineum TaxID=439699 RepID=A0A2T0RLF4_9ACTN|nr:hypothetical protein [Pseudosporangium ferrugineum]PRY22025.1 hypothetical protein CLV70_11890 [Pseudosporangium ferrugineum]BCJ50699.1 hypothetical protein Asp14428_21740 [Actinoplanes sp. NBRC 14428]
MTAEEPRTADAESLAEKIRAFAPQLTSGERRLLSSALAAAALFGVPVAADLTVHSGRSAEAGVSVAAPGPDAEWGDIRGQFADDFTPGETWNPPVVESIKPPGEEH